MIQQTPPRSAPFRRTQRWLALLLAVAVGIGIFALLRGGNPRDYVLQHYRVVNHTAGSSAYTLVSERSVSETAAELRDHWKPAQQLIDPAGVFLRYQDLVVAITPRAEGGSSIYLDDERTGYAHWYPFLVGSWGIGSPVDGTRGGGPGSGK